MENRKNYLSVALLALLVVSSGTAVYFYKKTVSLTENPNVVAQKETADLVARVGKLIALPTDETPTIATVSEPEKLKDQPFFANAKVGDKVLLYSNARKAYLYDPSENKLIEVAPINIGEGASTTSSKP